MDQLLAEMETDKYKAAQKKYLFIRKWWIDHIVGEDKKYSEFLKDKGVE